MTKRTYIQLVMILLTCALGLLAGCSVRDLDSRMEKDMYGEIYLNVSLNIDNSDSYSRTGQPDNEEVTVDGVEQENVINSLHLFWRKEELWQMIELDVSDLTFAENKGNIKIAFDKNDYPTLDNIEMWLGANLSREQADAFMGFSGIYNLETTSDWANELAPMYSDFSGRDDIAMFCVKSSETTLVQSAPDEEYSISFDLKRLVAKVMVACKEDNQGYVPVVPKNETDFQGWIKRSEVLYSLNGVNRSTYISQMVNQSTTDYDANVMDPNQRLDEYTKLYDENDESAYLSSINNDFYYYDVIKLMSKNELYKESVAFDEEKNYTDGIYCPENTFNSGGNDIAGVLKSNQAPWGMITSVSIKARFTPRFLNVEGALFDYILGRNDEELSSVKGIVTTIKNKLVESEGTIDKTKFYSVDCYFDNVAKAFLKYSLVYNRFISEDIMTGNGFPDKTYFYHNEQKEYYTYGAAKIASGVTGNTTELGNCQPYYDGWGFYYTYIDNRLYKDEDFVFYKHGQVERNRYYVLTINSFSNPGSSVGQASYVEVNTEVIPWKTGGRGDIELE